MTVDASKGAMDGGQVGCSWLNSRKGWGDKMDQKLRRASFLSARGDPSKDWRKAGTLNERLALMLTFG